MRRKGVQGDMELGASTGRTALQSAEMEYNTAVKRKEALLPGALQSQNWSLHDRLCEEVAKGQCSLQSSDV